MAVFNKDKIKILLNATTINVGGALFVTINFIRETLINPDNIDWYYIVSKEVKSELNNLGMELPLERFSICPNSPAKFRKHYRAKNSILTLERQLNPDLVFSIGSPSYINFQSKEVHRLTNPYITHLNKFALKCYPIFNRIKILLKTLIQRNILRNSRFFITQTLQAKTGIINLTQTSPENVRVIPNSISRTFASIRPKVFEERENYIFCLAATYPHKNINKIPFIAHLMREKIKDLNFKFILTIPEGDAMEIEIDQLAEKYNVLDYVANVGKLTQEQCKYYYEVSKVTFLPTYLETFSATLIESMQSKVAIVTTNFDFNKEICGNSASYFNPGDWNTAAKKIIELLIDENQNRRLTEKGSLLLNKFASFEKNYNLMTEFLKEVVRMEC